MTTQLIITDILVLKLLNVNHDYGQDTNVGNFLNFLDFLKNHTKMINRVLESYTQGFTPNGLQFLAPRAGALG